MTNTPTRPVRRIQPFMDRLFIRTFPVPERRTEAGIIVTARAAERETEGSLYAIVLAVGGRCTRCTEHGSVFKRGDIIRTARYSGTVVYSDNLTDPDIYYAIIREDAVLCWEDREAALADLGLTEEDVPYILTEQLPTESGPLVAAVGAVT